MAQAARGRNIALPARRTRSGAFREPSVTIIASPRRNFGAQFADRHQGTRAGTLCNWVHYRRIPFVKAGGCLRFDYAQVLESLRQYTIIEESASGRRIIR
jgi:hypothetical protein